MANSLALGLLKANLGYFGAPLDPSVQTYLEQLLDRAQHDLNSVCGIAIIADYVPDADLLAMYAAWLYRCRVNGEGKPPMLRQAILDRQIKKPETEASS